MLLIAYLLGLASVQNARAEELCPGIDWVGEHDISLTDTEKRLICGDRDGVGPSAESWRTIPFPQAKFNFETFLQDRGRFQSKVVQQPDGRISIDPGPVTQVSGIEVEKAPAGFDVTRRREIVGETLTPKILDTVQQWSAQKLQSMGYACPLIESQADPITGTIRMKIDSGPVMSFYKIIEKPIEGLAPGMLRRYDGFRLGDRFDGRLPGITVTRILRDGIVQSVHFGVTCEDPGAVLTQETIPGPPRLLSFGFGIDTEGLLLLKASWKNTRLGKAGSLLDLSAFGSAKQQRVSLSFDWYHLPYPSRRYVRPLAEVIHENEQHSETLTGRGQVAYGTSYDDDTLGLGLRVGPALESVRTYRGGGPQDTQFLSLDTEVRLIGHEFEFYQSSPRSGYSANFLGSFNSGDFVSDVTAHRLRLNAKALLNLGGFDPPLWVVGLRGGIGTTLTPARPGPDTALPPTYRSFLGGSSDLRGFGRRELPDELGGLSSAFTGLEIRSGARLPLSLQPFVFTDVGSLGRKPGDLSGPLFWSPGFGIRWASPIGVLRTSLAHGYLSGDTAGISEPARLSHLQFYFSLGEEF